MIHQRPNPIENGALLFPTLGDAWGREAALTPADAPVPSDSGKVGDLAVMLSIVSSLVLLLRG